MSHLPLRNHGGRVVRSHRPRQRVGRRNCRDDPRGVSRGTRARPYGKRRLRRRHQPRGERCRGGVPASAQPGHDRSQRRRGAPRGIRPTPPGTRPLRRADVEPRWHCQPWLLLGAADVWSLACFAFMLSTAFKRSLLFDPESLGRWQRDSVREVDIVTGCLLLVSRACWNELGGFDPRFFMYGEEADLAYEPRRSVCDRSSPRIR